MNPDAFIARREPAWRRLETLVDEAHARERGRRGTRRVVGALDPREIGELSRLYRSLAADLMTVRREGLDPRLEARLDRLTARAHHVLYAGLDGRHTGLGTALLDFPGAVRRNALWVGIAAILFFVPLLGASGIAFVHEPFVEAFLGPQQMEAVEAMYRSAPTARASSDDAAMTGFYVWNNIGIAFRCFATGLLFGLGPIFYLVYNGLAIGVVAGHLARVGLGDRLFPFVASHAPWELTAIALAGGAGLQMGMALVLPRGRTRVGRLRSVGPELVRQVVGVAAMLALAAVIEGNWSPSALPPAAKYATGAIGALSVLGLLAFGGRGREVPPDARGAR